MKEAQQTMTNTAMDSSTGKELSGILTGRGEVLKQITLAHQVSPEVLTLQGLDPDVSEIKIPPQA